LIGPEGIVKIAVPFRSERMFSHVLGGQLERVVARYAVAPDGLGHTGDLVPVELHARAHH
jgi:hypothetical protein